MADVVGVVEVDVAAICVAVGADGVDEESSASAAGSGADEQYASGSSSELKVLM